MLAIAPVRKADLSRLPWLAVVVLLATAIAVMGVDPDIGVPLTAIGWLVPFLVAMWVIGQIRNRISFPLLFWAPWICYVVVSLVLSDQENALQRSVMILTPILIGVAISGYRVSERDLQVFASLCKVLALWLLAVVILITGLWTTGVLPEAAGTAAQSITAVFLAALFATRFGCGFRKDIWWWLAMIAIPFVGLTRMAMAVSVLCILITPAPIKIAHRLSGLVLIIMVGISVFYSDRVQTKMFSSGEGEIWDLSYSNPDFQTSGRSFITEELEAGLEEAPWIGHGANASEVAVVELTGFLKHPHNDWLRYQYDYGYLGMAAFLLGMIYQTLHAGWRGFHASGEERVFFFAGACSLVAQAVVMFTDNIVLYAAFFGNLQFTVLGLAYARAASRDGR